MGVELGEASVAEQDALESLLSKYSFHDAAIGVVSLAASIYYFGVEGMNDVNVLALLAVAVVAGLNQEASFGVEGVSARFHHSYRDSKLEIVDIFCFKTSAWPYFKGLSPTQSMSQVRHWFHASSALAPRAKENYYKSVRC